TEFRLSANKQERALKASVIVELANELCTVAGIGRRSVATFELALSAYQAIRGKLHSKVTPEAFILAVEKVWDERIRGVPSPALASIESLVRLAKAARQVRSTELEAISKMPRSDRGILLESTKINRTMLAEFKAGVREYAELELDDVAGQAGVLDKLRKMPMTTLLMANPSLVERLDCAAQLKRLLDHIDPAEPVSAKDLAPVASKLQSASAYESTTVDATESGNDAQRQAVEPPDDATGGIETVRATKIRRSLTNMRAQNIARNLDRPLADAFQDQVEVDD
ncbi:hypothetical protein, partial [Lacisediminimonas sp.]|uniref:hypothetical protein n=1 Tax=Lacisediminimonas sp. TaxID=3060582 RepID=UPI0027275C54